MSPTKALAESINEFSEVFMQRSGRDFRRFMEETDLSFSQLNVLMRLFHRGNCGVSEIGEQLGVSSAAASQTVDHLVQLGLVERTEDPADRRAKQLTLSLQGNALIAKGIAVRSQWFESLMDVFTSEQQQLIISSLTLLTEAARKTED